MQDRSVNTPYDDAFRTLLTDCSKLIIPVINEVFGKHYTGREAVIPHEDTHFLTRQDGDAEKRITDSSFSIEGEQYLLECQSRPDSSMLIRIFEYSTQIALDSGEITGGELNVTIPNSAVIFLRSTGRTPDKMTVRIHTPGGSVGFGVMVLKIKDYDLDALFSKKLFFLLPFYIFTREKDFPACERDAEKLEELKAEYAAMILRLDEAVERNELMLYYAKSVIEMSKVVLQSIAARYDKVREGVDSVMGGHVLEHESKTIFNAGIAQGLSQGISMGENRLAALISKLMLLGRQKDIEKAMKDKDFREKLYAEFHIS